MAVVRTELCPALTTAMKWLSSDYPVIRGTEMALIGKKDKTGSTSGADLSQIIKGMQHAVNEAQKTLEAHHLNSLLSFFHSNGEPKTVSLHVEGDKYIDVPTFTLASHSALKIDELEMQFKAKIQDGRDLEVQNEDGESDKLSSFEVGFTPTSDSSDFVSVRILFKSIPQSEGFSRVLDEFEKTVTPYTSD